MSVEVKHVTRLFGNQRALDNISFEAHEGQVLGFLGPNGAGKSTMMKIITCFLPQHEGRVLVKGKDTLLNPLEVRRMVGYLPENNPLYGEMYVREYLAFAASLYPLAGRLKERVSRMIALTGLEPEQHKKIGALSKGYRQRVGIAQALIHDPPVLILDEPTTGLDPNQLVEIRQLIREAGKTKTVILSTHIMQEVEAICDRVVIIHRGKIVADDDTRILRQQGGPGNSVEVEFDRKADFALMKQIPEVADLRENGENRYLVTGHEGRDISTAIFRFAMENGLSVITLQRAGHTLENIFQQLTRG